MRAPMVRPITSKGAMATERMERGKRKTCAGLASTEDAMFPVPESIYIPCMCYIRYIRYMRYVR